MTGCSVQEKHILVSLNVQYVCIYILNIYIYMYIYLFVNTVSTSAICGSTSLLSNSLGKLQVEEAASQKQVEEHLAHCRFAPDIFSITETAPGVCLDLSI